MSFNFLDNIYEFLIKFTESARKEQRKKVHEEVIAEDYDNTKEDIDHIDLSQQFMVCINY